jgi:aminopeptidase
MRSSASPSGCRSVASTRSTTRAGHRLTIGLLPSSGWRAARFQTVDGIEHMPNLPTEEVFTTPDPERTTGRSPPPSRSCCGRHRRARPRRALRGRRAVDVTPARAARRWPRSRQTGRGASGSARSRWSTGEGRIGSLGTIFYDTLLDENAASHIALGQGFPFVWTRSDRDRANASEIHIDFMIGSNDLTVTGITADGGRVPVLAGGAWQL